MWGFVSIDSPFFRQSSSGFHQLRVKQATNTWSHYQSLVLILVPAHPHIHTHAVFTHYSFLLF
ncbi:MAG: hypothetical protein UW05_C0002G0008 [Candidatus Giovannonibacteria bacterium GW2011_GWC2_43_8]|nr:MAG: hypothetical protein UW05_C0002G0008 [Candidatus Giovannonibacteria bacterium GW2011_GWC2_43_8]